MAMRLCAAALMVSACGGGAVATAPPARTTGPGQATPAPVQATPAPAQATPAPVQGTPAPNPGGDATATVILTGGPDAGTYTASGNPNCSDGLVGAGIWGAQFSIDAADGQLSSIQVVAPDAGVEDAHFSLSVTIGPLLSGTTYSRLDGDGASQVTDNGSTAVIHATGTTDEGVAIDATVVCPAVFR